MVSILCLRCLWRTTCEATTACLGFNSLFEMLVAQGAPFPQPVVKPTSFNSLFEMPGFLVF